MLSVASCVEMREVPLPELDSGVQSAIVILEWGELREAHALDVRDGAIAFPISSYDPPPNILVLLYERTLTSMFLEPGALVKDESFAGRHPPIPANALFARGGEAFAEISSAEAVAGDPYQKTRISVVSPNACLEARGCYSEEAEPYCVRPCPSGLGAVPMVEPPAMPELDCPYGSRNAFPDDPRAAELAPALVLTETCDPGPFRDCTSDQLWHMGLMACEPVTSPCPLGQWPPELPADTIYVAAGESLAAAVLRAPAGATIALEAAVYEDVVLERDVVLRGACAATTLGAVLVRTGHAELRDLTVDAPNAVDVEASGSLHMENVIIADGEELGVRIAGSATIAHSRIGARRIGLFGGSDLGSLTVRDSMWSSDRGAGAQLTGGHTHIVDSAFRGDFAESVLSGFGGTVQMDRSIIQGSKLYAIWVQGSTISVSRSLLRNLDGVGVLVQQSGRLALDQVVVQRMKGRAMVADGPVTLEGRDLFLQTLVNEDRMPPDGAAGQFFHGATVYFDRVAVTDSELEGWTFSRRARGVLRDMTIIRTGDPDHDVFEIREEAQVDITRLHLAGVRGRGVYVKGGGLEFRPKLRLSQATFFETGRGGMEVVEDGLLEVDHLHLVQGTGFGLSAYERGAELIARDVWMLDLESATLAECKWNCAGVGVHAGAQGTIDVERFFIESVVRGARVSRNGELDLAHGRFSATTNAVLTEDQSYDLRRLFIGVEVFDIEDPIEVAE